MGGEDREVEMGVPKLSTDVQTACGMTGTLLHCPVALMLLMAH